MNVTVLGLGSVGAAVAQLLLQVREVPIDLNVMSRSPQPNGAWLDLADGMGAAAVAAGHRIYLNDRAAFRQADVVIHAAGSTNPRGASRLALAEQNRRVTTSIFRSVEFDRPAFVVVITNPVDVVARCVWKVTGFDPHRVMGIGTFLDAVRLQRILADRLGCARRDVEAWVLGEHGDSQVAVFSRSRVEGQPVRDVASARLLARCASETQRAAFEIRRTQAGTWWGVAACTHRIVQALVEDRPLVAPLGVLTEGPWARQLGYDDLFLGLPVRLDRSGWRFVDGFEIDTGEWSALRRSADTLASYR